LLHVKVDFNRPTLLTADKVKNMEAPVYTIVADNDIFFPWDKTLERCRIVFKNFKEEHILKNTKHIPDVKMFSEIEAQLKKWLEV